MVGRSRPISHRTLILSLCLAVTAGLVGVAVVHVGSASAATGISAVGGLADSQGNGVKTLSVKPATTGDVLVLTTKISSASVTATSVSGGGTNTWTKAASFKDNASHELGIWFAPITSVGTSTITVTYSGSVTSTSIELTAQEFTTGQGASTSWSLDVASGQNNPTSAAVASPTLTSATSGELYVGYSRSPGQVLPGSTAGVTYDETTLGNILLYDTNVSGTITPTSTQSPADTSSTIGALLAASTLPSDVPTVASVSPICWAIDRWYARSRCPVPALLPVRQ